MVADFLKSKNQAGADLYQRQGIKSPLTEDGLSYWNQLAEILSNPSFDITSRDQIINPYDYLNYDYYRNSARGQSLYNEDLARLQQIALQQEAAYKEYYDSAPQQALRDKQAGLNPNLNEIDPGSSASGFQPTESPLSGIPTTGDMLANIGSAVASLVGSTAQLVSLPFSLGSSIAQKRMFADQSDMFSASADQMRVSTLSEFEKNIYGAVSNNLADAIQLSVQENKPFDFDSWFAEPKNFDGIFESYAPSDNPMYRSAFSRAIKNVQKSKAGAYDVNKQSFSNQSEFAQMLADPYTDLDLLIQVALTEDFAFAQREIERLELDFRKKVIDTKTEYINGLDVSAISEANTREYLATALKAEYDSLLSQKQSIISGYEIKAKKKLWDIYDSNKYNRRGLAAFYLINGHAPATWSNQLNFPFGLESPSPAPTSDLKVSSDSLFPQSSAWLDEYLKNSPAD